MIANGGIVTVKEGDAVYLLRYLLASSNPDNPTIPWQTVICPECGDIPTPNRLGGLQGDSPYVHILDDDGYVLIGCEGYYVINPNAIGIKSEWSDWHEEIGQVAPNHTLATHEAEMPNCDDPDCEFHHPESD